MTTYHVQVIFNNGEYIEFEVDNNKRTYWEVKDTHFITRKDGQEVDRVYLENGEKVKNN